MFGLTTSGDLAGGVEARVKRDYNIISVAEMGKGWETSNTIVGFFSVVGVSPYAPWILNSQSRYSLVDFANAVDGVSVTRFRLSDIASPGRPVVEYDTESFRMLRDDEIDLSEKKTAAE